MTSDTLSTSTFSLWLGAIQPHKTTDHKALSLLENRSEILVSDRISYLKIRLVTSALRDSTAIHIMRFQREREAIPGTCRIHKYFHCYFPFFFFLKCWAIFFGYFVENVVINKKRRLSLFIKETYLFVPFVS